MLYGERSAGSALATLKAARAYRCEFVIDGVIYRRSGIEVFVSVLV
ncbi:MAG: hypothetical protein ACI9HK_005108 [Pirellulaceae bacterium]|jgi:hypothetical protein